MPNTARAANLPRERTSFVGRNADVARVSEALRTAGLVTLVGTGGVGKTRLALRVAAAVQTNYAFGAWLVELAPIRDPRRVAATVAATFGVREREGWTMLESLRAAFRGQKVLIVLDNCEHVLQSCADLVLALLQSCEDLTVLATSREPLRIEGEVVHVVPPLPLADPEQDFDQLLASEAVQLLVERVRAVSPRFEVTPRAAQLAARVCRLVDGLPLAIELAAARARTMSLAEIAERLDAPLQLLTTGPRTAPERQQTLRSTIDWSYALLNEAERMVLRRLAVFSGGCTAEGARAVCGGVDVDPGLIRDVLDRLTNHSLLTADTRHQHARFTLLETLRQYCLERLDQAGETDLVRQRHAEWCLSLVAAAPAEILDSEWTARVAPDIPNLRAALRWLVATGQHDSAAQLALRMAMVWNLSGRYSEGRAMLTAVLDFVAAGATAPEIPQAGIWAAVLAANQGDYLEAERLAERALQLARASADAFAVDFAENTLGWVAFLRGDVVRAQAAYEHTYAVAASPDHPMHRLSRHQLVLGCIETGDLARAAAVLDGLIADTTDAGSRFWVGRLWLTRAQLAEQAGAYADADQMLDQSIQAARNVDDQPGLLQALTMRGWIAVDRGKREIATATLSEAVDIAELHGSKLRLSHLLEAIGNLLLDADPSTCVRLAAAAEQLRTSLGAAPMPTERERVVRCLEVARRRLGVRAYAELWHAAPMETLEGTLANARQALRTVVAEAPGVFAVTPRDQLSEREQEVAVLVARGFSNREIAEELVISLKTVEAHVHHVLSKLGLANRVQIATWGLRHGVPGVT